MTMLSKLALRGLGATLLAVGLPALAAPVILAAPVGASPTPTGEPTLAGSWVGALSTGTFKVRLVLHLAPGAGGGWTGTLDSPDQGQLGIPLDHVRLEGDHLVARSEKLHGGFTGTLSRAGDRLEGTWEQGSAHLPLVLERGSAPVLARPQEPKPPFPYTAEEVRYPGGAPGVTLAGTLTVPRGPGPFPAVLLIPGSGQHDRDCTIFGHKPFKLWADTLTRRGFAVLRTDDRGSGGSTGDFERVTTADLVKDAEAGVAFLKARPGIDARRLGLIGHSEGGLIAPLVAAETPAVAFIVMLAGPGLPGDQIIEAQVGLIGRAMGQPEAQVEANMALQRKILDVVKGPATEPEAHRQLQALLPAADQAQRAAQEAQLRGLLSPWYRYFVRTDPREALARVKVPVLAINGEADTQVAAAPNLAAIRATLEAHGNRAVTTLALPHLNHLFQTARTGLPDEYVALEETLAPRALEVVGDWLAARAEAP